MKKTAIRLTAAVMSAAIAAACIRLLPDTIPFGIRADAAEETAEPLHFRIVDADAIVSRGSGITVHTEISGTIPNDAWMAVVPAWVPHTEEDGDRYNYPSVWLKDIEDGVCTLKVPDEIGTYEVRAYDGDSASTAKEIGCFRFETTFKGNMNAKIRVENRYVKPGTDLKIYAELSGEIPDDAWISFVPSDVAHTEPDSDAHNGEWKRVNAIEDGGYVIKAPNKEGNYDIRVFDGDYGTAYEVTYLSIYLTEDEEPNGLFCDLEAGSPVLRSQPIPIKISMTGEIPSQAWIAVVPSETAHTEKDGDDHNGDWKRLKDIENGELTLKAPNAVGSYDIRVYDGENGDAKEIANRTVSVVYSTMYGTVSTDETWVKPGAEVTVRLNITGDYPNDAWFAFVPTDVAHTEKDGDDHNGNWKRVKDAEDGIAKLRAPSEEGFFDVRLYDGEDEGASEVAFCTLTVSKKTAVHSAFETIEAESAEELSNLRVAQQKEDLTVLGFITNEGYAVYQNLDFGSGAKWITVQANASSINATGGTAELHLDSTDGKLIGKVEVPLTGSTSDDWLVYETFGAEISGAKGVHDLYIVFRNETTSYVMNLDKFTFSTEVPQTDPVQTTAPVQTTTASVQTTTVPVLTTEPVQTVKLGDVNEDGSVDLKDVTVLRRHLAGGWNVTINETNSDVNKDGSIDLKDVTIIRRYLAGGWGITL